MAKKPRSEYPESFGFTGSAGKIPVRGHMRSPSKPKAGNLAIMKEPLEERRSHRPDMKLNHDGSVKKGCY